MRLRGDWGVICLYLAIKISMSILGEKGIERKKSSILFSSRYSPSLLFSCHLSTSKRFWNFRKFWPHYLIFSHFSTPQCQYHPVGPKIWIGNTSIWPLERSWAEKNLVGKSFWLNKWGLKTKNFWYLMNHKGKGVLHIGFFCNSFFWIYI